MAQPVLIKRESYLTPDSSREIKYVTLLRDAVTQLHQNHILDLSIEDMARRTSISKRTIYRFFQGKDRLIAEAICLDFMQWEGWFFETLRSRASSPAKELRLFCTLLSEWKNSPDFGGCLFARALFSENRISGFSAEAARECAEKCAQRLMVLMKAGKKKPKTLLSRLFITSALAALSGLPSSRLWTSPADLTALLRELPAAEPEKGRS
ncbi:MAG: TetR/AcrR family transcriptional regulator [Candidatus Hydrogenedens sp.]|jgi:AcrR family transcriptional regulator|nr:TetR/AcrR family transcriptional regulator [Candidatus Hydrogenedens sp.]